MVHLCSVHRMYFKIHIAALGFCNLSKKRKPNDVTNDIENTNIV